MSKYVVYKVVELRDGSLTSVIVYPPFRRVYRRADGRLVTVRQCLAFRTKSQAASFLFLEGGIQVWEAECDEAVLVKSIGDVCSNTSIRRYMRRPGLFMEDSQYERAPYRHTAVPGTVRCKNLRLVRRIK